MIHHHYWENATLDKLAERFAKVPQGFISVDIGLTGAAAVWSGVDVSMWLGKVEGSKAEHGFTVVPRLLPQRCVALNSGAGNWDVAEQCGRECIQLIVLEQPFIPRLSKVPGAKHKGGSVKSAMRVATGAGVLLGQVVQALDGEDVDAVWMPAQTWQVILERPGAKRAELKQAAQERAGQVIDLEQIRARDREGLADAMGMGEFWARRMWWELANQENTGGQI